MVLLMSTRTWWLVIAALGAAIILLTGFLFAIPTSKLSPSTVPATTTGSTSSDNTGGISTSTGDTSGTSTAPLSSRVMVTSPQPHTHVGHAFTVAGVAPGPWYFEAQFPVQVRDPKGNIVGRAPGLAAGDWQTDKLVTFTANMQVDATYHGPATLILLKDNPSGLPENDDAVSFPIIID